MKGILTATVLVSLLVGPSAQASLEQDPARRTRAPHCGSRFHAVDACSLPSISPTRGVLKDCRLHQVTSPAAASGRRLPDGFRPAPYGPTGEEALEAISAVSFECKGYSESWSWIEVIPPRRMRSRNAETHAFLLSGHSSRPATAERSRPCLAKSLVSASIEHEVVAEATEEHFFSTISSADEELGLATRVNGLYYEPLESTMRMFVGDVNPASFDVRVTSRQSRTGTGTYVSKESSFKGSAVHADDVLLTFSRACLPHDA